MNIGIVIAVTRELTSFLESDFKIKKIEVNHHIIYHTHINNNDVYAICSGCGLIDASSATQLLISKYNVELILNYGVTGALDPNLKVNDLFIVTKVCNHDYDTSAFDPVKKCQYIDYKDIYIPIDKNGIALAKKIKPDLKEAILASGNSFIEDKKYKSYLFNELKCNICDMELAAIARVCDVNKIKLISIKSISDTVDGNGKDFEKNVINSAKVAFKLLKDILLSI